MALLICNKAIVAQRGVRTWQRPEVGEITSLLTQKRPWLENIVIGKDPDAGEDSRLEGKGTAEDEMVGWHHWLNGYEFEQTLGDGEGQGSLVGYSPWGHKESDITERLNNTQK